MARAPKLTLDPATLEHAARAIGKIGVSASEFDAALRKVGASIQRATDERLLDGHHRRALLHQDYLNESPAPKSLRPSEPADWSRAFELLADVPSAPKTRRTARLMSGSAGPVWLYQLSHPAHDARLREGDFAVVRATESGGYYAALGVVDSVGGKLMVYGLLDGQDGPGRATPQDAVVACGYEVVTT